MKKSIEEKVLELGQAKANVDQLGKDFWNAVYECPNENPEEYESAHIIHALRLIKEGTVIPNDESDDPLPGMIEGCPACQKAFKAMEDKKRAKRILSGKKGIVLKAAKLAYENSLKAVPNV